MAVLKDVFCRKCGCQRAEMLEGDQVTIDVFCTPCWLKTPHDSRCTGGQKLKCYAGSYDGRDWSGDMEFMGIEATYEDGKPVLEANGERTDAVFQKDFKDRIDAKRDRKKFENRQATGDTPLHFHK